MDVDEVTIDPSVNWQPVDKPKDIKDEEGMGLLTSILPVATCTIY